MVGGGSAGTAKAVAKDGEASRAFGEQANDHAEALQEDSDPGADWGTMTRNEMEDLEAALGEQVDRRHHVTTSPCRRAPAQPVRLSM